jgi:hypothetical protein
MLTGAGRQARQVVEPSKNSILPAHPAETSDGKSVVAFKDGRLSTKIQNGSLWHLADELSRKTGVRITLDSELAAESVSVEFQDLPVEEGLRQLFKKYDAFFLYSAGRGESSRLTVVWVYPHGKGSNLEPVPPEEWASTEDLHRMFSDPDPEVRARALEGLLERKGDQALADVQRALQDPDEQVRASAIYATITAGVELPKEDLCNVALNDPAADMRLLALRLLAGSPDAQSVANFMVNDRSEAVRNQAQEMLRHSSTNQ